jgi:hypothetical protein
MIIEHNPEEFEDVYVFDACDYHKKNPKVRNYAGCTCSFTLTQKKKEKDLKRDSFQWQAIFGNKIKESIVLFKRVING